MLREGNVDTFPEFCKILLEQNGFVVQAGNRGADGGYDLLVRAPANTLEGHEANEWTVVCTTRTLATADVDHLMGPVREGRPVLVMTTADLPASMRAYLKSAVSNLFPFIVWDREVLYLRTAQRPFLGHLLSKFITPERFLPSVNAADNLAQRLTTCRPGKKDWRLYEDVMVDILRFLFVPPLGVPRVQARTLDRLEVRDALFPNRAHEGFWLRMHHHWSANFVLFEFKNTTAGVGAMEVDQVRIYTQRKSIGRLAFVVGRAPARQAAVDAAKVAYQYSDLMVILLDDTHMLEMLQLRAKGEEPTQTLEALMDIALLAY